MIEGQMNEQYEAMITMTVNCPEGATEEAEAVVDTGFNWFLCLPETVIQRLHLPYLNSTTAFMADDRSRILRIHQAQIDWDGKARTVEAHATGATALIGMQLMTDHRLEIDIRIGDIGQIHSPWTCGHSETPEN